MRHLILAINKFQRVDKTVELCVIEISGFHPSFLDNNLLGAKRIGITKGCNGVFPEGKKGQPPFS